MRKISILIITLFCSSVYGNQDIGNTLELIQKMQTMGGNKLTPQQEEMLKSLKTLTDFQKIQKQLANQNNQNNQNNPNIKKEPEKQGYQIVDYNQENVNPHIIDFYDLKQAETKTVSEDTNRLERALQKNPTDIKLMERLATEYVIQKKPEKALHHFKNILKYKKDDIYTLEQVALCYNEMNNQNEEEKTYKTLLDLQRDPFYFYQLGLIYHSQKLDSKLDDMINQLKNITTPEDEIIPDYLNMLKDLKK
ncbi:tetratricopeptide repeat protein [bacterium]|nr:tetratricopeptide repeat protein [bacterium]